LATPAARDKWGRHRDEFPSGPELDGNHVARHVLKYANARIKTIGHDSHEAGIDDEFYMDVGGGRRESGSTLLIKSRALASAVLIRIEPEGWSRATAISCIRACNTGRRPGFYRTGSAISKTGSMKATC